MDFSPCAVFTWGYLHDREGERGYSVAFVMGIMLQKHG